MSLQQPLRRWVLQPLKSNFNFASQAPMTMRAASRRPFSIHIQTPTTRATRLRTPLTQRQRQYQQAFRSFHSTRTRANKRGSSSSFTYESPTPSPSLSQRLKTLSKEYGWSALWIYLFLSALDFPFCFAAVRLLGADRIGHYEHVVVEGLKGAVDKVWPGLFAKSKEEQEEEEAKEAQAAEEKKKNGGDGASLWTQLALAYAIHKSFIFVRVPVTAAITPKVVKQLRRWGWDVLKGKPKAK
ncbi:Putative Pectinesterase [Aspergillus calidoustus]|uniref:Putative Pectinesterase n=1 Tax=Aspergillus calidoustus TaxID=454130 RepID=A0A0U5FVW9_ASPCI|nr:Putative Pectinesterase [Aspergillus calidoustus]